MIQLLLGTRRATAPDQKPPAGTARAQSPVPSVRASRHIVRGWAVRCPVSAFPVGFLPQAGGGRAARREHCRRRILVANGAAADSILGFLSFSAQAQLLILLPFVFLLPDLVSDSNPRRIGRTDGPVLLAHSTLAVML